MSAKSRILFENENFEIVRRGSNGRREPGGYIIERKNAHPGAPFSSYKMMVSEDELFELTNALDDICDDIEDREEAENGL